MRQVTSWSPVPDAERNAVDDRGPAVGPHDQQAPGAGEGLEGQFLRDRHVVGKQHHVQAEFQRLQRLGGGVVAGDRYQREVGIGIAFDRQSEAGQRQRERRRVTVTGGGGGLQHRVGGGDRLVAGLRLAPDDDQQIRGRGLDVDRQIGVEQLRQVRRRGHQARCLPDAFALAQPGADLHQRDRILVQVPEDLEADRAHVQSQAAAAGEGAQAPIPASSPLTVSAPEVAPTASAVSSAAPTTSRRGSASRALRNSHSVWP
jgi:hypothetical protein